MCDSANIPRRRFFARAFSATRRKRSGRPSAQTVLDTRSRALQKFQSLPDSARFCWIKAAQLSPSGVVAARDKGVSVAIRVHNSTTDVGGSFEFVPLGAVLNEDLRRRHAPSAVLVAAVAAASRDLDDDLVGIGDAHRTHSWLIPPSLVCGAGAVCGIAPGWDGLARTGGSTACDGGALR